MVRPIDGNDAIRIINKYGFESMASMFSDLDNPNIKKYVILKSEQNVGFDQISDLNSDSKALNEIIDFKGDYLIITDRMLRCGIFFILNQESKNDLPFPVFDGDVFIFPLDDNEKKFIRYHHSYWLLYYKFISD